MAQKDNDLEKIKQLIDIMKQNDLVEVEIKHDEDKIFLKRSQPQPSQNHTAVVPMMVPTTPPAAPAQDAALTSTTQKTPEEFQKNAGLLEIKSPMVGTFYAAPSPDSDPCVEIDSDVTSQTVVCIIEAMKVMNEIKADVNGKIVEILVTNGQAVEYGQILFKVKTE